MKTFYCNNVKEKEIQRYNDRRSLFDVKFIDINNNFYTDAEYTVFNITILKNHLILVFSGIDIDADIDISKIQNIIFNKFNEYGEIIESIEFNGLSIIDESTDTYKYDASLDNEPIQKTIIIKYKNKI